MTKKIVMMTVALLLTLSSVFATPKFSDVKENEWYSNWVGIISDLNITSGYPDGSYKPDNQLKRIELLSFALKSLKYDIPVSEGYWGQNILDKAVEIGLVTNASTDITYNEPEGYITREETARVIYNAYLKNDITYNVAEDKYIRTQVKDIEDVEDVYLQGVIGTFYAGIVEGYGDKSFKPKNTLTRAEASVFITRLALRDKRAKVQFDLPTYSFKSSNPDVSDFTLRYSEENQDLVNIHQLVNTIENADTTQGFAEMGYSPYTEMLLISLYESEELFNTPMRQIDLIQKTQWSISGRINENPREYAGDIEILTWRDSDAIDRMDTIKSVFDYLFEVEAEDIFNRFVYRYNNQPNETYEYRAIVNGREVILLSDGVGVGLDVSKKKKILESGD